MQTDKKDCVIVRTPLIPTLTATKENIEQISRFISSCYDKVKYELLNYNPLAKAKYSYLDKNIILQKILNCIAMHNCNFL